MPLKLSDDNVAAIAARIRAFEARTGAEAVTAVVDRSDHYHGLRWRAFALGVAVAAPTGILADLLRPDWIHAHAVLFAGLACALLATAWPAFERLFLQRVRAEAEALQRAKALFLARELTATASGNGVVL